MPGHNLQDFLVFVPSVSSLAKEGQKNLELALSCCLAIHQKLHGLLSARLRDKQTIYRNMFDVAMISMCDFFKRITYHHI
jgi:hypothetical protein